MKVRKTIKVETVKDEINRLLKSMIPQSEKRGLCTFIETILFSTGNYNGYSNNYWTETGCKYWEEDGKPDFPEKKMYITGPDKDEYGRRYF